MLHQGQNVKAVLEKWCLIILNPKKDIWLVRSCFLPKPKPDFHPLYMRLKVYIYKLTLPFGGFQVFFAKTHGIKPNIPHIV